MINLPRHHHFPFSGTHPLALLSSTSHDMPRRSSLLSLFLVLAPLSLPLVPPPFLPSSHLPLSPSGLPPHSSFLLIHASALHTKLVVASNITGKSLQEIVQVYFQIFKPHTNDTINKVKILN